MSLQISHTVFNDGTKIEHTDIEDFQLWDLTKKWREEDAKKPRKGARIVDWARNKFRTA